MDLLDPCDARGGAEVHAGGHHQHDAGGADPDRGRAGVRSPSPARTWRSSSNTDSAVFKHQPTQQYYVLVSGRWFAAASLHGPWAYVAGQVAAGRLREDPARRSQGERAACRSRARPRRSEAVIANSIPQTAAVKIAEAKLTVAYDGAAEVQADRGHQGADVRRQHALPVIRIDADKTCWCVENGVWFTAKRRPGRGSVATSVPGIIYTIPVEQPAPLRHLRPRVQHRARTSSTSATRRATWARASRPTASWSTAPATPTPRTWGTVWVGYPPTYGYGAGFAYGAASGFAFGFAAGAVMGSCWTQPYWGPYYGGGLLRRRHQHAATSTATRAAERRPSTAATSTTPGRANRSPSGSFSSFNPYSNRSQRRGIRGQVRPREQRVQHEARRRHLRPRHRQRRAAGSKVTGDLDEGTQTVKRGAAGYNENTGVVKGGGTKTKSTRRRARSTARPASSATTPTPTPASPARATTSTSAKTTTSTGEPTTGGSRRPTTAGRTRSATPAPRPRRATSTGSDSRATSARRATTTISSRARRRRVRRHREHQRRRQQSQYVAERFFPPPTAAIAAPPRVVLRLPREAAASEAVGAAAVAGARRGRQEITETPGKEP